MIELVAAFAFGFISIVLALGIVALALFHFQVVDRILGEAAREREGLLTRIQAWDPNVNESVGVPAAQTVVHASALQRTEDASSQELDDETERFTSDQLAALGLRENSDGGYLDAQTGALWETVEDVQEWRAMCRKKGWPENVHPGMMQDDGAAAAVFAAKNAPKENS